ncbi:MAG TPA: EAL domain-containing protein, partial [Pseudomonadales bacterium]
VIKDIHGHYLQALPLTIENALEHKRTELQLDDYHNRLEAMVQQRTKQLQAALDEHKKTSKELKENQDFLRAIMDNSSSIICVKDLDSRYILVNKAFEKLLNVEEKDILGQTDFKLLPENIARHRREIELNIIRKKGSLQTEEEYQVNGETRTYLATKFPLLNSAGHCSATCHISTDITPRKNVEKEMSHIASHDVLTGLPNRSLLWDRLKQAITHVARYTGKGAIVFIDLDNFKDVNDSLGHNMGDELLKHIATQLRTQLKATDTIARIGGDEFAIVMTDISDINQLTLITQRILNSVAQPCIVEGRHIESSASIGISIFPDDGLEPNELMKNADLAMYSAKASGRNAYRFFQAEMNQRLMEQKIIAQDIRTALDKGHFELYFQPQVHAPSNTLVGTEALIRWKQREDIDQITTSPSVLISVAEQTGLIKPIGEWVLDAAGKQLLEWSTTALKGISISINLSSIQFHDKNLLTKIIATIKKYQIRPELLKFEITESILMRDVESAIETMQRINQLGCRLSIDDFGTGYSSLSYLRQFPVQELKIDRSFVTDIESNPDDAIIAKAIISLGHSLGLRVVAEGVEYPGQQKQLMLWDCDIIQGFYYSPGLSASALMHWHQEYAAFSDKTAYARPALIKKPL